MTRLGLALLIAPGLLPVLLLCAAVVGARPSLVLLVAAPFAAVSYFVAVVAGLPLLVVLWAKRWLSAWHFACCGAILGLLPLAFVLGQDSRWLPVSVGLVLATLCFSAVGAFGAIVFWAVGIRRNVRLLSPNLSARPNRASRDRAIS